MLLHWQGNWQRANRAEVPLRPLVPLLVQPLLLQLGRAFLAGLLLHVLLALTPLAIHAAAAVFDEYARHGDEETRQAIRQHDAAVSRCPKDAHERHRRELEKLMQRLFLF